MSNINTWGNIATDPVDVTAEWKPDPLKEHIARNMPDTDSRRLAESLNVSNLFMNLYNITQDMNPYELADVNSNASMAGGVHTGFAALKYKSPYLFEMLMQRRKSSFTEEELKNVRDPIMRAATGVYEAFSSSWERQKFNRLFFLHALGVEDKTDFKVPFEKEIEMRYLQTRSQRYSRNGNSLVEAGLWGLADLSAQIAVPVATSAALALTVQTMGLALPVLGASTAATAGTIAGAKVASNVLTRLIYAGNTFLQEGGAVAYDMMYNRKEEIPINTILSAAATAGVINAGIESIIGWSIIKGAAAVKLNRFTSEMAKNLSSKLPGVKVEQAKELLKKAGVKPVEKSIGLTTVEAISKIKSEFVQNLLKKKYISSPLIEAVNYAAYTGAELSEESAQDFVSSFMTSAAEQWQDPNFKVAFLDAVDSVVDNFPELWESLWMMYLLPMSGRGVQSITQGAFSRQQKKMFDNTLKGVKDGIQGLTDNGVNEIEVVKEATETIKNNNNKVYANIEAVESLEENEKQLLFSLAPKLKESIMIGKDVGSSAAMIEPNEMANILVYEQKNKLEKDKAMSTSLFGYSKKSDPFSIDIRTKDGFNSTVVNLYRRAHQEKRDSVKFKEDFEKAKKEVDKIVKFGEMKDSKSKQKNQELIDSAKELMAMFYMLAKESGRENRMTNLKIVFLDSEAESDRYATTRGVYNVVVDKKLKKSETIVVKTFQDPQDPRHNIGPLGILVHELGHYIYEQDLSKVVDDRMILKKYFTDNKKNRETAKVLESIINEFITENNLLAKPEHDYNPKVKQTTEESYYEDPTEVFGRVMTYNFLYKTIGKSSVGRRVLTHFDTLFKQDFAFTDWMFSNIDMYNNILENNKDIDRIIKEHFLPNKIKFFLDNNNISYLFDNVNDLVNVLGMGEKEALAYLKTLDDFRDKTIEELNNRIINQYRSKDAKIIRNEYNKIVTEKITKIRENVYFKIMDYVSQKGFYFRPSKSDLPNPAFKFKIDRKSIEGTTYKIPNELTTDSGGIKFADLLKEFGVGIEEANDVLAYIEKNAVSPFKSAYKEARDEIKKTYNAKSFSSAFNTTERSLTLNSAEIINNYSMDLIANMLVYEMNLISNLIKENKRGFKDKKGNIDVLKRIGKLFSSDDSLFDLDKEDRAKYIIDFVNYRFGKMKIDEVVDSSVFLDDVAEFSDKAKQELSTLNEYTEEDAIIVAKYNEAVRKLEEVYGIGEDIERRKDKEYQERKIHQPLITRDVMDFFFQKKDKKLLEEAKKLEKIVDDLREKVDKINKYASAEAYSQDKKLEALDKALVYKFKQIVSYVKYTKSVMLSDRIIAFKEIAKNIIKNPDKMQKESRHTYAMQMKFLHVLGFRNSDGSYIKYDPEYTDMSFQEMHDMFFYQGTRGGKLPITERRLSQITAINDLRTSELISLMEYFEDIKDIGIEYTKIKQKKRKETMKKYAALIDQGLDNMYDFNEAKTGLGKLFRKGIANSTKFATIMKYLTNNDLSHPLLDFTVYQEVRLQSKYFQEMALATTNLNSIYESLLDEGESISAHFNKEVVIEMEAELSSKNTEGFERQERAATTTIETLFMILLNMGNEGNKELMCKYVGKMFNTDPVDQGVVFSLINKYLTTKHFKAAQQIWDMLRDIGIKGFKEYERTHGIVPEGVAPSALSLIDTETGERVHYKGGYFPILITDSTLKAPANPLQFKPESGQEFETLQDIKYASNMSSMTFNGNMQERNEASDLLNTPNGTKTIDLTLERFGISLTNILKDFSWRRYLVDTNSVFLQNKDIKNKLVQKLGEDTIHNIKKHIQAIAGIAYEKQDVLNIVSNHLRKGATTSILGFSVGTGLVQLGGIVPSVHHIGLNNVLLGVANLNNENYLSLMRKSPLIMDRGRFINRDISRTSLKESTHDKINKVAFAHIVFIDSVVAKITFIGAINKYNNTMYDLKLTPEQNEEKSILYASNVVNDSQGAGLDYTLSAIEATNSPLHRMFTMFMTFGMAALNSMMVAFRKNKQKTRIDAEAMRSVFMYSIAMPIINAFVRLTWLSLAFSDDEEDKEASRIRIGKEFLSGVIGNYPLVGNIGYSYLMGVPYRATPLDRLVDEVGHLVKATSKTLKGQGSEISEERLIETLASIIGVTAVLPVRRPAQFATSLYRYWDDPDYYFIDFLNKNISNINKKVD